MSPGSLVFIPDRMIAGDDLYTGSDRYIFPDVDPIRAVKEAIDADEGSVPDFAFAGSEKDTAAYHDPFANPEA